MNTPTLLEKELDELYKKVKKGEKLGRSRRFFAYALKLVAGGAGLAIATGKVANFDQELGIAVLVAVFIDTVFSNHMRLIAETEAGHAYAALARRVKSHFNRELGNVDESQIEELKRKSHIELSTGIDEIEQRLAEVDIKALKSLSLDDDRRKGNGE
jgi:hypothetical protein